MGWAVSAYTEQMFCSAITKTGVDVTFDALEEDMEDVTIEVKDNKGNVVEVKPLNLVINETEGSFLFETALTADPTGVWTVAGIEFDCDAAAKLDKINKATSELALYNALTAAGIKNLDVANSSLYYSELPSEDFESLAEVQEYVDGVNADAIGDAEEQEIINELVELLTPTTPSQVQVLAALQGNWQRVNEDFISGYITDLQTTTPVTVSTTLKEVQDQIDAVNVTEVGILIATALATADRDDYNDAVAAMQYVREDDPEDDTDTVKADMQADLDELNLVINVLEAKTAAQFTNAYNALVAFVDDKTVIGEEVYYTDLRTKYMEQAEDISAVDANDIETAILMANTQKRAELFNDVANVVKTPGATQTKTADVLKKLQALAAFVPDKTDFDIDTVVNTDTRLADYRANFDDNLTAIGDVTDYTSTASPAAVKTAIQGVQTQVTNANNAAVSTPLAAVAAFDSTDTVTYPTPEADLLALLKDKELALGNVIDANSAAYLAEESDITTEAGKTKQDLKDLITNLNQVQVVAKAKTGAEARPGLAHIAIVESTTTFINLTAAQKSEVSALFIDDDKFGASAFAGAARSVTKLKDYTNTGDVDTDLAVLVAAYDTALIGVNTAANIGAMVTALEALEYDVFDDLTAAEKIDVADYFLDNFPMDDTPAKIDYTTFAAIQAAVDAAIAAVK